MRLWDGVHDGHEPVDEAVFVDGEFGRQAAPD
jgi:hypothetical protein